MNEYTAAFKNYAVFSGRASRRDYWMFALINAVVYVALWIVDMVVGTFGLLAGLYALAALLPSLALATRRLHDTDRSGWLQLISFIPIAGLVLVFFLAEQGKPGDNKYGPDPNASPAVF